MSQQTMVGSRSVAAEAAATAPPRPLPAMLFAMVLLVSFAAALGMLAGVDEGNLTDTDAYSWANRVIDLRTDGRWFDETIQRIDPPTGHVQHWSRPFDVVLLVGGVAGAVFVDFTSAMFAWAIVLPLLLAAATVWLLWWGFADVVDAAGIEAQAVLIGTQPIIAGGYMAGRADHQAVIALLLAGVVGLVRKAVTPGGSARAAGMAGGVSALGLWIGMEFVLVIGSVLAVFAIEWVRGQSEAAQRLTMYTAALTAGATAALFIENGWAGALHTDLDELSLVFVVFGGLTTMIAAAITIAPTPPTAVHRTVLLAAVALAGVAVLVSLFPALLGGPLGHVDPFYARTRLQRIAELQPMIVKDLAVTVSEVARNLSLLPFAVIGLVTALRRRDADRSRALLVLLVPAALYLPLSLGQVRWALALNLLLVVPAALGVQRLMRRAFPRARRVHLGVMLVPLLAATWWLPASWLTLPPKPVQCDPSDAVPTLADRNDLGSRPRLLMTQTDYGPEMLFHTPHTVLSIPNHRPQPGYRLTFAAMTATDDAKAHDIVDVRGVDLILVCTASAEASFYGAGRDSFHRRLTSGQAPDWLREVSISSHGPARMRLYEVVGR